MPFNKKILIIKGEKMPINKKYYMYDTNNHTRSQEPTTRNLEIQENGQTELKKLSQTNNYVNNTMADYLGINLQVARLLGQIYQDQRAKKYCYSSNRRLSDQCNLSQRSVTNYLKKLQELGMIHSEVQKIHKNRKVKSERTILVTNEFYEVAERCACKPINRINKWEIASKPNKISESQIVRANNKYISKDIYKERKGRTENKRDTYNQIIHEFTNTHFKGNNDISKWLKEFVRVLFMRERRVNKGWFLMNSELQEHLSHLLKITGGNILLAISTIKMTVKQRWGQFYVLSKKQIIHVKDKVKEKVIDPIRNMVQYVSSIGSAELFTREEEQTRNNIFEFGTICDQLSVIVGELRDIKIGQVQMDAIRGKYDNYCELSGGTELLEDEDEETWESKYGPIDAINNFKKIIDIDPENGKIERVRYETHDYDNFTQKSGSASYSASEWHLKAVPEKEVDPLAKYGFGTVGEAYDLI